MDNTISFGNIIKKSALKLMPDQISNTTLVLSLAIALILGIGVFCVYRKYFIGVVYDHSFNISLVIMTLLVTVIIVTISSNITLSLGMVGALSIVRYRTAVKNPLDLMFLFWTITLGIAVGAGYYYIAVICFAFVALVLYALSNIKGKFKTYVLIINYRFSEEIEEAIRKFLNSYDNKIRSKIVNDNQVELNIELNLKNENITLTNALSQIDGVDSVTLVQYRNSFEL